MPPIQPFLRNLCNAEPASPTLKRWAILGMSLRDKYMHGPIPGQPPDPPISASATPLRELACCAESPMRAENMTISLTTFCRGKRGERISRSVCVQREAAHFRLHRAASGCIVDRRLSSSYPRPMRTKQGSCPAHAPAQAARLKEDAPKPTGRPSSLVDTRVIYCGDCLDPLRKLPDACVDLIYIDPPFNSNRNYEVFWGETKEKRAFEDRHGSTQAYIEFMRPRCIEMARVLKKTGSFYYHCDDHASHYVKVMLDQIFGENNFINEIIWKRTTARSDAKRWNQLHDTLFVYSGGGDYAWNPQFEEYGDDYLATKYRYQEPDGRRYRLGDITSPNPRPNMMYDWKGFASPEKGWRYSKETMTELDAASRIWYPENKAKRPQIKRYLDEMQGILMGSVWIDIAPLNSQAIERLGYPTQKPLALLERIIQASSNENDIVLDAFCGCGTALVAAQNLKRQWIGIDISPTACRVMAKRLRDVCGLPESEPLWKAGRGFVVRDLPWSEEKLRAIPHFEFRSEEHTSEL